MGTKKGLIKTDPLGPHFWFRLSDDRQLDVAANIGAQRYLPSAPCWRLQIFVSNESNMARSSWFQFKGYESIGAVSKE